MTSKICKKNQFAPCKFGRFCFYEHEDRKCMKVSCSDRNCSFRHPPLCRNILQNKICQWGSTCSFDHGEENSCESNVLETSEKRMRKELEKFKALVIEKDYEIHQKVKKVITRVTPVFSFSFLVVMLSLLKLMKTILVTSVTTHSRKYMVLECTLEGCIRSS